MPKTSNFIKRKKENEGKVRSEEQSKLSTSGIDWSNLLDEPLPRKRKLESMSENVPRAKRAKPDRHDRIFPTLQGPEKYKPRTDDSKSVRALMKETLDLQLRDEGESVDRLADALGITYSKVRLHYRKFVNLNDPLVKNAIDYEDNLCEPVIRDRFSSAYTFWQNEIRAPQFVLDWLVDGIKIDFFSEPILKETRNNKNAMAHEDFVTKTLTKLLKSGVVEILKEKPIVVNPLSVACNAKGVPRLCIDMSCTNLHSPSAKYRPDDARTFFAICQTGIQYAFTWDFKSCFHQCLIHKDCRGYTGFSWVFKGKKYYLQFVCMPFGMLKAPWCCFQLFKPWIHHWRTLGIPSALFVDDGVGAGFTKVETKMYSDKIRRDLTEGHVLISPDKSKWEPSREVTWLGFLFDLKEGGVSVSEDRVVRLLEAIEVTLTAWPFITAREVARVIGSLISMDLVMKEEVIFYTRFLQEIVKYKEREDLKWNFRFNAKTSGFADEGKCELIFWKTNIRKKNFRPFKENEVKSVRVFGDAGAQAQGGWGVFNGSKVTFHNQYTDAETERSSGYRELSCLLSMLHSLGHLIKNKSIIYCTDSMTTHIVHNKGSPKMDLHQIAKEIRRISKSLNVNLSTAWVPREWNQQADDISKQLDFDVWEISFDFFKKVERIAGKKFTVDVFADELNHKCKVFFSRWHCQGSSGVNGMAQPWSPGFVLLVPPVRKLVDVLIRSKEQQAKGVIIYPKPGNDLIELFWESPRFRSGIINKWFFKASGNISCRTKNFYDEGFFGTLIVVLFDFRV